LQELKRVIGTGGAVMMGLGAIIGSGVFVGIGLCAERSGSLVVAAIIVAALLATFNCIGSA
jgi:APA family basic amino acid/polyamine antiporter